MGRMHKHRPGLQFRKSCKYRVKLISRACMQEMSLQTYR